MGPRSNRQDGHGRAGRWRHTMREKSHQESHSQDEAAHLTPIAAHPLVSQDSPAITNTAEGVKEMVGHLRGAGAFAFDSEFIGEMSYEPRLCLVQVATAQRVFVLDPLAGLDLSALWEIIADGAVEKIVLAGQQDFGPAVGHVGRPPANVLDLQIAAGLIHVDYPLSLMKLLQEFAGVSVGKGLTFTHWDKRPLSAVQMRYAADDVRYLPAAREVIGKRLEELGRMAWAWEESAAVLGDLSLYQSTPETLYLRVRGRERLRRRNLAILRELAIVRDSAARQENVPTRTLLKDAILLAMAARPARTVADLDAVKGLPRPVETRYGQQIVEATARALALPDDQLPASEPGESFAVRGKADEVLAAVGAFCLERSVSPSLVTNRREVTRVCQAAARGQPLEEFRLLRGWRKELLGEMLEKLL